MKDDDSDPVAFMIVFQFLVAGMIFFYMAITKTSFPDISKVWFNLILNGFLIAVGSLCMFKALKITEAAEYTILSTSATFINLVFASIFLHEVITTSKIVGTLLIVVSIIIVTIRNTK